MASAFIYGLDIAMAMRSMHWLPQSWPRRRWQIADACSVVGNCVAQVVLIVQAMMGCHQGEPPQPMVDAKVR